MVHSVEKSRKRRERRKKEGGKVGGKGVSGDDKWINTILRVQREMPLTWAPLNIPGPVKNSFVVLFGDGERERERAEQMESRANGETE